MATAAPTADTIAALIATAVSDGVADMQQRLVAGARGHVQTAAAAARTEAEGRSSQGAQRALAELRCQLAEIEALLDRDVRDLRGVMPSSLRASLQWRDDGVCDGGGDINGGRGGGGGLPGGDAGHNSGTARQQADISDGTAAAASTAARMAATLRQHEALRLQLTRAAEELELGVQSAFRSDVTQSVAARFAERYRLSSLTHRLAALETGISLVQKDQVRRSGSGGGVIGDDVGVGDGDGDDSNSSSDRRDGDSDSYSGSDSDGDSGSDS